MYASMIIYNHQKGKSLNHRQSSIQMLSQSQTALTSAEEILEKLFISDTSKSSQPKNLRLNLKLLKQISQEDDNYRTTIELILVLERILYTGKKRMSLRELVYKSSSVFRGQKSFSFSGSSGFGLSPKKQSSSSIKDKQQPKQPQTSLDDTDLQKGQQLVQNNQQAFVSDELSSQEKKTLVDCLTKIRSNLTHTTYEIRINSLIDQLLGQQKKQKYSEQEVYKKLLTLNSLGLDGNKNSKIEQFIQKGYQTLDGKFSSFESLYTFMSNEVLPLIQRKILSISINNHQQRQNFIGKAINFLSEFFLHQYILEIKINKATLIENRIFVQKIIKENLKKNQTLILSNLTNIINEALLCPSNMNIQLGVFRLLKRMYLLWGTVSGGSVQFIQLKSDEDNLGNFIKYPLLINLKNISLYCKSLDNEDEIKEAAMFCYKVLNAKEDLYLCNEIETLSQMRFIKDSKYFSSKAYAFSQQISRIYDTFELRMGFWKYYRRIQRGQVWVYNVLIQKPNSLLIWQFYLQGHDIGFGIYKVQSLKKQSMEQYSKQIQCKQILKIEKYTVTQTQPQKGFIFLKNGFYRLVFDNSYSKIRGKDLSYMILHLESDN